jgi:MFS family permease
MSLTAPAPRLHRDELRAALRRVTQAWIFGAAWMYIVTGAVMTRFAQQLGTPGFGFGVLAALPFAGALVQLPVSYFIERYGHRKIIFIGTGVVHRALWIVAAAIPWVLPARWCWPALLGVVAVSWVTGQMSGPSWVSWMADLVPARIRGRYFSRRTQLGQLVGVIVTLTAGAVLDLAQRRGDAVLLRTLSGALALAGAAGVVDFLFFVRVPEPRPERTNPQAKLWALIREPLGDRNFRRFLGYIFTLTLAVGYMGQFTWLYLFDVAGMSNTQANAMLVLGPLVVLMLSFPFWGRLIDRFGRKPVLVMALVLTLPGGALWMFVTREHWLWPYLGLLLVTAAWPGIDLANFNLLLNFNGPASSARKSGGYVAINSIVAAAAGILSGLLAGAIANALNDWRPVWAGWPMTYHRLLFLLSSALRLLTLPWLWRLEDTGAQTTRAAWRYMGTNLYSNLQQVIFMPGRLLWQRARWTFIFDQTVGAFPWCRRRRR